MRLRLRLYDRRRLLWGYYGLVLGLVLDFGLLLADHAPLATGLGIALAWGSWAWWRAMDRHRALFVRPEVKTYPEGCSCIRGAFEDNPSCPHHGDE